MVGTPGRVKALMDQGSLPCSAIRLLILDEVDKLMAQDFEKDVRTHVEETQCLTDSKPIHLCMSML